MGYHPRNRTWEARPVFLSFLHHGSILPEKSCPVRCAQRMIQCCNPKRRSSPDAPQDVLEETNVWERGSKITILLKHMNSIRIHCNRTILASCHVQLVAAGKQGRCTEHMRRPATSFALQTLHPVPARLIIVALSPPWFETFLLEFQGMILKSLRWHSVVTFRKKSSNHFFPSQIRFSSFVMSARPDWASANVLPKEMDEGNIHPGSRERLILCIVVLNTMMM